ncbi:hypothetical protein GR11A_00016 [Vibrio phage vB_VcorM_GR11A]|nr:hypothetical protein GR11A_00016 [Vibrio phage vB_VcorM_GR11A]
MPKGSFKPKSGVRVNNGRPRISRSGVVKVKRATYGGGSTKSDEWKLIRNKVLKRDGYRCTRCGRHKSELKFGESLQVDHIKQVSRGGTDSLGNLRTLCAPKCHGSLFLHDHIRKRESTKKNKKLNSDKAKRKAAKAKLNK